jgi:hypothetical protein
MYALKVKPALSTQSDFTVAIATVHRSVTARFKGYLGVFAAVSAYRGKHFASGSIAIIAGTPRALCFPRLAARKTALGLIGVASGLEELLLISAEGEGSLTIGTLDRLVLKLHWMTSFLLIVG